MSPLNPIVSLPDGAWQKSLPCPELLFPDHDPSMSPPTPVSPGLDRWGDFQPVQHAAGADDVESRNGMGSFRDDSITDDHLTESFFTEGCIADLEKDCFTDGFNEGCFIDSSAVELPPQPCQAYVGHSWLSTDDIPGDTELFDAFIRGDAWDASVSSFTESLSSPSTSHQSPTESLNQYRGGAESSPSCAGDFSGWSPLTTGLLSVDEVGRIMDEDDQLRTEERTPPPDTSKQDEDDDVVFLYARERSPPKRLRMSRRHQPEPRGQGHSPYAPSNSEAPSKPKNRSKANKLSKRREGCGNPTPTACDPCRWTNEWFRLEKIGVYGPDGQSASEYTWMGHKRGWVNSRQADAARRIADVSQLSYVVVRRSVEGYKIKASWNEEGGMFMGEDGMNSKTVRLRRSEVQKLLADRCKSIQISG